MNILEISSLSKSYASGHQALKSVSMNIERGEIFALLGPNGAGKTTLISIICGLVTPSSGSISVSGYDIQAQFRKAREIIGLVPQELSLEGFESVINSLRFSRKLFGKPKDDALLERILSDLSLLEKRDASVTTLSGGMKRRVLIAKALAHEPELLFLDEPTAGVDVSLRKDMWAMMERLRENGTTIILTTHYIEEAEHMADRIGIISKGELLLVEEKASLMSRLGKKELRITLDTPCDQLPESLAKKGCVLDKGVFIYHYDGGAERTGIRQILDLVHQEGLVMEDMATRQSSLEDIFVELVGAK